MKSQNRLVKMRQHRANYLELRLECDNTEAHRSWPIIENERQRLKNIINYKEEEQKELNVSSYKYNNKKIKTIALALLMYIQNSSISEIVKETRLSKSSIYNYIDCYKKNKLFLSSMYKKPDQTISELRKYRYEIVDDFETSHIRTYKEAQERIFKITGIKISISNIFNFLTNNGFEKIDGYYKQVQTDKIKKERLLYEEVFLEYKKDEIKNYILNNHLESDYRLIAKIRRKFNIRYVPRSWLSRYLIKEGIKNKK